MKTKTIVLGGGCFWCTEAVFDRINGIEKIVSGYTAGDTLNPTYKDICSGSTGHAEVVQMEYNPDIISLKDIFLIFLTTHDPTTLNRQGADRGTQYRSIICVQTEEERKLAESTKNEVQKHYSDPIVTEIVDLDVFYSAEKYHQNYYERNSYAGYCRIVIDPKIKKLRDQHKQFLKEE